MTQSDDAMVLLEALLDRINDLETRVSRLEGNKKKPTTKSDGSQTWDFFSKAYLDTYGVHPIRNATTNAQAAALVGRVGKENACDLVIFYLSQKDAFYVRGNHPLGLCLKDCEGLMTRMRTGKRVTPKQASEIDNQDGNVQAVKEAIARKHAK